MFNRSNLVSKYKAFAKSIQGIQVRKSINVSEIHKIMWEKCQKFLGYVIIF